MSIRQSGLSIIMFRQCVMLSKFSPSHFHTIGMRGALEQDTPYILKIFMMHLWNVYTHTFSLHILGQRKSLILPKLQVPITFLKTRPQILHYSHVYLLFGACPKGFSHFGERESHQIQPNFKFQSHFKKTRAQTLPYSHAYLSFGALQKGFYNRATPKLLGLDIY